MKLQLFKDMARAAGNGTTINDIILLCLSIALGRYFDKRGKYEDVHGIRLILPIANPLRPSLYGDKYHGLCNRMTPVIVPLPITYAKECEFSSVFHEIQAYMSK
eukprot:5507950-Ditylum_brightwellii.AAC.1